MEEGRIWLRVRRGWSQWNGLVGDGALKPGKRERICRLGNIRVIVCTVCVPHVRMCASPNRKGLLCVLLGGLAGIRASRLTSEAPVGPRKASGVRHKRIGGALSGGASRDRSNISGLAESLPFNCGLTGGSLPNGSDSESTAANGSGSVLDPNSSASTSTKENRR